MSTDRNMLKDLGRGVGVFFDGLAKNQVTERGRGSEKGPLVISDLEEYNLGLINDGGNYYVVGRSEDIERLESELGKETHISFGPPRELPIYPPLPHRDDRF